MLANLPDATREQWVAEISGQKAFREFEREQWDRIDVELAGVRVTRRGQQPGPYERPVLPGEFLGLAGAKAR